MELYSISKQRRIMIRHYQFPKNKASIMYQNGKYINKIHNHVDHKDDIKIYYKLDGQKIEWIKFGGVGCVISISAIDMVINEIINKSREKILEILDSYEKLIKTSKLDDNLGELNIFYNIVKNSNDSDCAFIISNALKEILK